MLGFYNWASLSIDMPWSNGSIANSMAELSTSPGGRRRTGLDYWDPSGYSRQGEGHHGCLLGVRTGEAVGEDLPV
eukprot:2324070-Rhodomonas_salina.1